MKTIRLLLIGVWLGSAIFFSAVVAPAAFTVLRAYQIPNATEIAGTIVNRTLAVVNITGFVFSLFALITALVLIERSRSRLFFVEMLSLGVLAVATAIGHWFIAAKMQSLRAAAVLPIDQSAPNDPRKVQF